MIRHRDHSFDAVLLMTCQHSAEVDPEHLGQVRSSCHCEERSVAEIRTNRSTQPHGLLRCERRDPGSDVSGALGRGNLDLHDRHVWWC